MVYGIWQFVFGQIWSDLVPLVPGGNFVWVRFGLWYPWYLAAILFWSDLVFGTLGTWRLFVFGQIWSDFVRFGPMVPLVPRGICFLTLFDILGYISPKSSEIVSKCVHLMRPLAVPGQ